jgi:hypothetical protein
MFHFLCRRNGFWTLVIGFFVVQYTKTGKIYQMSTKYTKVQKYIPNGRKIDQMAMQYMGIFHRNILQI